jgi:hypothetical protein
MINKLFKCVHSTLVVERLRGKLIVARFKSRKLQKVQNRNDYCAYITKTALLREGIQGGV